MRRISIPLVLLFLLVACLVSGIFGPPPGGAETLNGVVQQAGSGVKMLAAHQAPDDLIGCLRLCWFSEPSPSIVLFYTSPDDPSALYSRPVGRYGGKWYTVKYGASNREPTKEPPFDVPIDVLPILIDGGNPIWRWGVKKQYLWLSGYVYSPKVQTVETTLDTGEVVRAATKNRTYSIFADAMVVCEVRAFDKQGRLITRVEMSHPYLAAPAQMGGDPRKACSSTRVAPTTLWTSTNSREN